MSSLSPILDVFIGLVGVYIAFSLLASWLQERVAAFLNLRSKGLISGIYELFNGNTTAFGKFMQDPMFQALQNAATKSLPTPVTAAAASAAAATAPAPDKMITDVEKNMKTAQDAANYINAIAQKAPSYLSKEQFAAIFMNLMAQHGAADSLKTAAAALNAPAPSGAGSGAAPAPSPADVAKTFTDTVQSAAQALGVDSQVNAILSKAGGDYDKFVAGVENWYDDHMDRLSGWYKRRTHTILLILGLLLAMFFNIDSVRLYTGLSCSSALRGAASIAAAKAQKDGDSKTQADFVGQMLNAIPIGWARWPYYDSQKKAWVGADDSLQCDTGTAWEPATWYSYLLVKILGFVITMFALSMGAPFWFDALSCLTNVRAAGKKPDTNGKKTTTTTTTT